MGEWIRCSERMPEFGVAVLITDGEIVAMSSRSKLQKLGRNPWQVMYQAGNEWITTGEITHWQSLPPLPPKEVS